MGLRMRLILAIPVHVFHLHKKVIMNDKSNEGKVHFYAKITSKERPGSIIYIDDGFGNGHFVNKKEPRPDEYNLPRDISDRPREKCDVPSAYDWQGKKKLGRNPWWFQLY